MAVDQLQYPRDVRGGEDVKRTPLRPVAAPGNPWSTFAPRTVPLKTTQAKPKTAARGRGGTGQRKAAPPGRFSEATRLLVRTRAGDGWPDDASCEGCWRGLGTYGGDYQHRAARGSGGCRDGIVNGPANCLLLCRLCHSEAEERRRDLSQDGAGFWIEHGTGLDYDPRFVAVLLGALGDHGITRWLAADGKGLDGTGYLEHPPLGVAA